MAECDEPYSIDSLLNGLVSDKGLSSVVYRLICEGKRDGENEIAISEEIVIKAARTFSHENDYLRAGEVLLATGLTDLADRMFGTGIEYYHEKDMPLYEGMCYKNKGEGVTAAGIFRGVIKGHLANDDQKEGNVLAARAAKFVGYSQEQQRYYKQAIKLYEDDGDVLAALDIAKEAKSDLDEMRLYPKFVDYVMKNDFNYSTDPDVMLLHARRADELGCEKAVCDYLYGYAIHGFIKNRLYVDAAKAAQEAGKNERADAYYKAYFSECESNLLFSDAANVASEAGYLSEAAHYRALCDLIGR